jgi:hypothetical protein
MLKVQDAGVIVVVSPSLQEHVRLPRTSPDWQAPKECRSIDRCDGWGCLGDVLVAFGNLAAQLEWQTSRLRDWNNISTLSAPAYRLVRMASTLIEGLERLCILPCIAHVITLVLLAPIIAILCTWSITHTGMTISKSYK